MSFDFTVVQRMRGACNVAKPTQVIADLIKVDLDSHNNPIHKFVRVRTGHTVKHVLSAKARPFID